MNVKRLLIVVNVDWFFISHRVSIAERALEEGWEVYVAAQDTGRSKDIEARGIYFVGIPLTRSGINIFQEINSLFSLYKLYNKIKPTVVHHVTLKPVVYGSIISRILNIKATVNAISGLGFNFTEEREGLVKRVIVSLMRLGFNQSNLVVIFQNNDDLSEIEKLQIFNLRNQRCLIKGSGVDLNLFEELDFVEKNKIQILLPARMLKDKGVIEFIEAAELLKNKYKGKVLFVLAGMVDIENKAAITKDYLLDKQEPKYIEWRGYQNDMIKVYHESDIVVLPSYREGMPKSLIEACAIGRPIVTTNAIGCKECVDEGVNGFKVPVKSIQELADAIERLIISSTLRREMGRKSRLKAEREFSLSHVVGEHLKIYTELNNK